MHLHLHENLYYIEGEPFFLFEKTEPRLFFFENITGEDFFLQQKKGGKGLISKKNTGW